MSVFSSVRGRGRPRKQQKEVPAHIDRDVISKVLDAVRFALPTAISDARKAALGFDLARAWAAYCATAEGYRRFSKVSGGRPKSAAGLFVRDCANSLKLAGVKTVGIWGDGGDLTSGVSLPVRVAESIIEIMTGKARKISGRDIKSARSVRRANDV